MNVGHLSPLAPWIPTVALALVTATAVTVWNGVLAAGVSGTAAGDSGEAVVDATATGAAAQTAGTVASSETVSFSEAYLNDPANIEAGEALWKKQCRHCHGKASYPGKAPKLKPRRYTPDFVYDRVTYGFRKMPPWEAVYSKEERMAVVAYVLSREFSP